jgi:hypothetical protein
MQYELIDGVGERLRKRAPAIDFDAIPVGSSVDLVSLGLDPKKVSQLVTQRNSREHKSKGDAATEFAVTMLQGRKVLSHLGN